MDRLSSIALLSNNELSKAIIGLEVKKQNLDFAAYSNTNEVYANTGKLLIIDMDSIEESACRTILESIKKDAIYNFTCLTFSSESSGLDADYILENDFSNLKEILLDTDSKKIALSLQDNTLPSKINLEVDYIQNNFNNLKEILLEIKDKLYINQGGVSSDIVVEKKEVKPEVKPEVTISKVRSIHAANTGKTTPGTSVIGNLSVFSESSENTHILLADDSKPVRKFVTKILEEQNFDVTTFVNGQELIDFLNEGNGGDIILLDNQMPVKDGMTTLQEIKGHESWKNIPILFLSAITAKDQVVEALVLGADDYMEKPFNNKEFLARINVHVRIDQLKKAIVKEKEKSDKLILNTLPKKIVDDLKMFGKTSPETFEDVTVYFSDIVSFTNHSTGMEPAALIDELNILFTEYDTIMENHGCERIKTIGDAYLAVSGMPVANKNHAYNMAMASIEIARFMQNRFDSRENGWELRIGLHTGSVVGGIVGEKKYLYDVFGDTINTSSRMESNSLPMHINVSETTYELLKDDFPFIKRDSLNVKGKGEMVMYFLDWPKVEI